MSDDTLQYKPPLGLTLSPQGPSFAGVATAVQTMSRWKPEQSECPDHFSDFPLLAICPTAPEFFAQAGHFTIKDLKGIAQLMGMTFNPNNTADLYRSLIQRTQDQPWVFPVLETLVEQNRGGQKGPRSRKVRPKKLVIPKLPLSKLRLKAHPELHGRVHELLLVGVTADIATAAFCEYAIMSYYHKQADEDSLEEFYDEAMGILTYKGPTHYVESRTSLPENVEETDWFEFGRQLCDLLKEEPSASSSLILSFLHMAISGVAKTLKAGSIFALPQVNLLNELTMWAKGMHEDLKEEVSAKTEQRLHALGFTDADAKRLAPSAASVLLSDRFYNLILSRRERISETSEALDEIERDIAATTAEKKFARVSELAIHAEEIENKLARMNALHETTLEIIQSLGDTQPERFKALVEKLDPAVEADIFDERLALSDSDEFFEHLYEAALEQVWAESQHLPKQVDVAEGMDPSNPDDDDEISSELKTDAGGDGISQESTKDGYAEPHNDTGPFETERNFDDTITKAKASIETGSEHPEEQDHSYHFTSFANQQSLEHDTDIAEETDELVVPDNEDKNDQSSDFAKTRAAPIERETIASLFKRGYIAIAANAAQALEAEGLSLPIASNALRVAAASRAPHRGFGPDLQKFNELVGVATSSHLSDLASVLVLGAILRPAILSRDITLRSQVTDLCKGTLGQHLIQVKDTVSRLSFEYPPKPDELAELSGTPGTPERQRLADRLSKICATYSQKKSRWPFATEFLHHVVSSSGVLGSAVAAIAEKSPNALARARAAIQDLQNSSAIEVASEAYASERGYNDLALYPKGAEYLTRQFDEPVALIEGWIKTTEAGSMSSHQSEERTKITTATLRNQLEKAISGLEGEAKRASDPLVAAVARWIMSQLEETKEALLGRDTGTFSTLDEALNAEMDLLPPVDRDALAITDQRAKIYTRILNNDLILDQEHAIRRACAEGAFESAFRLVSQFDVSSHEEVKNEIAQFVSTWRPEVENRSRKLAALEKVDFKNQEEISRQHTWCKLTIENLAALAAGTEVHDIAGLQDRIGLLDETISKIELSIREGQVTRINEYRKPENEEDVEVLLSKLDELTVEAIEDRIAQLRDGRSAAVFETDLKGLIGTFTPEFLSYAGSSDWPKNRKQFEAAIETPDSPLFTEEDRRSAANGLFAIFHDIMTGMRAKKPPQGQIRELFEEIGFTDVTVSKINELGRNGSWTGSLHAKIESDGWFLPPIFGSNATSGYSFIVASPETLPETMIKAISDSNKPAIILLSGVADASRRHEVAERLRAKALPALLIDEALIAFAATRRDTRARTIFECGLPYGRIDPYTTDAGQLPPEMFFGREDEVRKIIAKTADGCLVYGGRQLGKSALLAHIAQTQHNTAEKRIIVNREVKALGNSEQTSDIWRHISSMLPDDIVKPESISAEAVSKDIQAWVGRHPNGRIICMFDEADNFMTKDTRDDYPQLSKLKELMEKTQRAFKVVFAGLHNVQRMHKQPNSPLWHLGEPICIGPLNRNIDDKRAAFDLVVSPMRAAGFAFESIQAVEEILTWANYYPSLVQEYMKGLLSTMHGVGSGKTYKLPVEGPLWLIPTETLFAHHGFNHIKSRIRDKFHLTLNLDPRYALVAYTLARLIYEGDERRALISGLSPKLLMEEAEIYWPKNSESPTPPAFEALLEELFDLGVLGRNRIPGSANRYNYLLRTREVAAMLGTGNDIYHALEDIENKDPTISYDRTTHRRRYSTTARQPQQQWPYAPLSDFQIEQLISKNTTDPVRIVCGLEVLGLSKVGQSLKRISETGNFPGAREDKIIVEEANSQSEIRRIIDMTRPENNKRHILLHQNNDPAEAKTLLDWLAGQKAVLDNTIRPVIVLSAANPNLRALAIRRHEQSQFLSPWGAEMIRVHLHDCEQTGLDTPELRQAILSATGGIPTEVTSLISEIRDLNQPAEQVKNWTVKAQLPEEFMSDDVACALWFLNEDGDFETKNYLLRERTHKDFEMIGPDLQATGLVTRRPQRENPYHLSALGRLIAKTVKI